MTEKELLSEVKCGNYQGIYESENGVTQYDWGKYDYSVSKEQQSPDYNELCRAAKVLNEKSNTHFVRVEYSDKFNSVYVYTYKAVTEFNALYEQIARSNNKTYISKINAAGFFNKEIDDKIAAELKAKKSLDRASKAISKKLGFEVSAEAYKSTLKILKASHMNYGYESRLSSNWNSKKPFETASELFAHLNSPEFIRDFLRDGTHICKATIYLKTDYINIELYRGCGSPHLRVGPFSSKCPINEQEATLKVLIEQFGKLYLSLTKASK